jgi:hypothetical protein
MNRSMNADFIKNFFKIGLAESCLNEKKLVQTAFNESLIWRLILNYKVFPCFLKLYPILNLMVLAVKMLNMSFLCF